jgi:hypothetical protein
MAHGQKSQQGGLIVPIQEYYGNVDTATYAHGFYIVGCAMRYLIYEPGDKPEDSRIMWYPLRKENPLYSPHGTFRFGGFDDGAGIIRRSRSGHPDDRIHVSRGHVASVANETHHNLQTCWDIQRGIPRNKVFVPHARYDPFDQYRIWLEGLRAIDISKLTPEEFNQVCLFEAAVCKVLGRFDGRKQTPLPKFDYDSLVRFIGGIETEHREAYLETPTKILTK